MECFICSESTPPLYQVCKCNTFVHSDCFAKLISTAPSHSKHCAVCKEKYDIKDVVHKTFKWSQPLVLISFIFITLDVVIVLLVATLNTDNERMRFLYKFVMSLCLLLTSISGSSLYLHETKRFNSLCCCKWEIVVKSKRITLPAPATVLDACV